MNEDYLWGKNGDDAELRDLEVLLRPLRFQDVHTPSFKPTTSSPSFFGRWSSYWPVPAFATVLAVLAIMFLYQGRITKHPELASKDMPPQASLSEASLAEVSPTLIGQVSREGEKGITRPRSSFRRNHLNVDNTNALRSRQRRISGQVRQKPSEFTVEEKFAYSQLLRALSVSSSTFRFVKNKIDGGDVTITENEIGR